MYILYDQLCAVLAQDTGGQRRTKGIGPILSPRQGTAAIADSGTLTYTISIDTRSTETTLGYNWDQYTYVTIDNNATEARSLIPGLPLLFPIPPTDKQGPIDGYATPPILPNSSASTVLPANAASYTAVPAPAAAGREITTNPTR